MARLLLALAAVLIAVPAFAANSCVIVVANDRASEREIRAHEIAHCQCGDWHPRQTWIVPPKDYIAPKPPKHCQHYSGKLEVVSVPTKTAMATCKRLVGIAAFGCSL